MKLRPSTSSEPRIAPATAARSSSRNSGHSVTSTIASAPSIASRAVEANATPRISLRASVLGDRVVRAHARARALEPRREHERATPRACRRCSAEREAEQRDLLADERPEVLLQLRDHAPLLQLVDLDHRVEQLEVVARVAGELLERGHVLGEARAAEADPGLQELRADAVVEAHAARDLDDVGAGLLAHVRDLVDERDLRRQEGVGGSLTISADLMSVRTIGASSGA